MHAPAPALIQSVYKYIMKIGIKIMVLKNIVNRTKIITSKPFSVKVLKKYNNNTITSVSDEMTYICLYFFDIAWLMCTIILTSASSISVLCKSGSSKSGSFDTLNDSLIVLNINSNSLKILFSNI